MSVGKLLKLGSYNGSRCTYFILNCAYLVHASLNSLYIHLNVLPEVEISATVEWAPLSYKHRTYNRENELSAAALNRTFTVLELRRGWTIFFFYGSHLWQSAETKFNTARKDSIAKNFNYLKHLAYNITIVIPTSEVWSGFLPVHHLNVCTSWSSYPRAEPKKMLQLHRTRD